MSIFLDENSKVVYQGLTGSQGRYYGLLNREYGTNVVAGAVPGKGGQTFEDTGVPVFDTVEEAKAAFARRLEEMETALREARSAAN